MSGWQFCRVSSIPTVVPLLSVGGRAAFSSRPFLIDCETTSCSWSSPSVVSCISAPGQAEGRKPGLARGREVYHRSNAYILDIRLPEDVVPFRLARKAAKYGVTGGGRPMRFIERIEPAGTEEAVCIQVAAADSLYVTEDFLLTHNTLNDAFIILDEAQNTTAEQMKMFLTRLGFGSKIVVTGDITQVDLPGGADIGSARGGSDPRRYRRHPRLRTHQCGRRAASAGFRDRRRV